MEGEVLLIDSYGSNNNYERRVEYTSVPSGLTSPHPYGSLMLIYTVQCVSSEFRCKVWLTGSLVSWQITLIASAA